MNSQSSISSCFVSPHFHPSLEFMKLSWILELLFLWWNFRQWVINSAVIFSVFSFTICRHFRFYIYLSMIFLSYRLMSCFIPCSHTDNFHQLNRKNHRIHVNRYICSINFDFWSPYYLIHLSPSEHHQPILEYKLISNFSMRQY